MPGVTWVKTDYEDKKQLTETLQGVDTVLSFVVVHLDVGNVAQKNLIDASIAAGVRRIAPSEWFSATFKHLSWYDGKLEVREYLKELNKNKKVIEYSLFQPGFFLDYFLYPHKSTKHIKPIELPIGFSKRRALLVEGSEDSRLTLTTVKDIVQVVVRAIDYEDVWPVQGGIRGDEITLGDLISLGEKIRGPFKVERLQAEDLEAGIIKSDWKILAEHPAIDPAEAEAWGTTFVTKILLTLPAGTMTVSDDWNKLLPEHKFTGVEEFLAEGWSGKP
ncbi:hypothetical protein ACHAQH_008087 [Verticillium albo-atrum]